jgi:hypothetical protein
VIGGRELVKGKIVRGSVAGCAHTLQTRLRPHTCVYTLTISPFGRSADLPPFVRAFLDSICARRCSRTSSRRKPWRGYFVISLTKTAVSFSWTMSQNSGMWSEPACRVTKQYFQKCIQYLGSCTSKEEGWWMRGGKRPFVHPCH